MTTSMLTLERRRRFKVTDSCAEPSPNGTVLSNGNIERPKKINFFSRKLKEFESQFETDLKWFNIITITAVHVITVICTLIALRTIMWKSVLYFYIISGFVAFGVTGGVHRLWCHRTYTANLPLRIILMLCYSASGQNTIYDWVRDHRIHHKYSETSADPHDAKRGFFFAHVGWLMCRKRPEVLDKGRNVDMSDILTDPVVRFHTRFFIPMKLMCCFILPSLVPMYFWNETPFNSFASQTLFRYTLGLNFTWLVNSAAHLYGNKPYDKHIGPVQNLTVSLASMGEGWHNYHHVFPWDYRAAELGGSYFVNFTTMWLDFFALIGWATDLKTASPALVKAVADRNGDGTRDLYHTKEMSF